MEQFAWKNYKSNVIYVTIITTAAATMVIMSQFPLLLLQLLYIIIVIFGYQVSYKRRKSKLQPPQPK